MSDHLYSGSRVSLPAALAAYGTDDFDDTLISELQIKEDELPTDSFCENHGRAATTNFTVKSVQADECELCILVSVEFDEVVASNCAEHSRKYPGMGMLDVTIDRETGEAVVSPAFDD